jgi:hypothetical protein
MKCTYSLRTPRFDFTGYKQTLDKYLTEQLAQGVVLWLSEVLDEIPTWSGASRATFMKLANTIGAPVVVDPIVSSRINTGVIASRGEFDHNIGTGQYKFMYATTLPWLVWNEYNNANENPDPTLFGKLRKPGPYNFQIKGVRAFLQHARTVRLPSLKPYVKARPIR